MMADLVSTKTVFPLLLLFAAGNAAAQTKRKPKPKPAPAAPAAPEPAPEPAYAPKSVDETPPPMKPISSEAAPVQLGQQNKVEPPPEPPLPARAPRTVWAGWTVGQNIRIDHRFGAGNPDIMRKQAAEVAALNPEVILAHSSAAVAPLLQASRTVPIVFALVADPVGAGYVASLARPGGNATGFTNFEYSIGGKWLELLKEIAPGVKRVAVLRESFVASGPGQFGAIQAAGLRDQ